jgi:hypothetical protein
MPRDLVEPEGVNAESDEGMRDAPPPGDPVPGGDPAAAPAPEPAGDVLGAPPEGDAEGVHGSEPPA